MQSRPNSISRIPNFRHFILTEIQAHKWWHEFRPTEQFPGMARITRVIRLTGAEVQIGLIHIEIDLVETAIIEIFQKGVFDA